MAGVCPSAQDVRVEWSTEFCSEVSIALWCAWSVAVGHRVKETALLQLIL